MALTPLTEARAQILAQVPAAPVAEYQELQSCLGRVLSEDVVATRDVPPFDNSAIEFLPAGFCPPVLIPW